MYVNLRLSEEELKRLIVEHFKGKLGDIAFDPANLKIEVKSAQNYKSEWEVARFRATYEGLGH